MNDDLSPDLASVMASKIHASPKSSQVEPIVSPEAEESSHSEQMAQMKRLQDKTKFRKARFGLRRYF